MRVIIFTVSACFIYVSLCRAQILGPVTDSGSREIAVPIRSMNNVDSEEIEMANNVILQLHDISTSDLHDRIDSSFDSVRRELPVVVIFIIGDEMPRPMRQRFTVRALIEYEHRPIGGILRITTDLVPMFAGVYCASRPIASHEFAEAVDNIDEDQLTSFVYDHIQKLGEEYTQKVARERLVWRNPNSAQIAADRSR